jgi:hypothetical protein
MAAASILPAFLLLLLSCVGKVEQGRQLTLSYITASALIPVH